MSKNLGYKTIFPQLKIRTDGIDKCSKACKFFGAYSNLGNGPDYYVCELFRYTLVGLKRCKKCMNTEVAKSFEFRESL